MWVPNFLTPGFARLTPNPEWPDASKIPDLKGKVAIVLGANSGLGYETALQLARKRAKVYVTARSVEKAETTVENIKGELENENVDVLPMVVMLDDFTQVRNAARSFLSSNDQIDILVNNAAVLENDFHLTKDGVESSFAVNYVSHFIFTTTLLPSLSPSARIVNVTSFAQSFGTLTLDLAHINQTTGQKKSGLLRYGQSKLAQVLFTRALQRRVGDGIFVNCCNPGQVRTGLNRYVSAPGTGIQGFLIRLAMRLFDQPTSVGALTQLYLATSPEVEEKKIKGELFNPVAIPAMDQINPCALDDDLVEKLWTWTEDLVNEKVKN